MKLTRSLLALALTFSLSLLSFFSLTIHTVTAQDSKAALQRGYRTGYSDGYMAGYRDTIDGATKSYSRHNEYFEARRAYNKDYGMLEDYQDGYQQGFEIGYDTGFEKRSFEAVIPTTLQKRGVVTPSQTANTQTDAAQVEDTPPPPPRRAAEPPTAEHTTGSTGNGTTHNSDDTPPSTARTTVPASFTGDNDTIIIIPRDTELIVELSDSVGTERNSQGDKFTAKVVSPAEVAGAVIEGRVDRIEKPGRIKKRSALLLSFDRIVLTEERWSNFDAILTEVLPVKGDNVKSVDGEGTAFGKSSIKGDSVKVGAATGTGATIGAVTGGPVGAAVGAGVGAAFGIGTIVLERGKHIRLASNQQLRIKTSYDTKIR